MLLLATWLPATQHCGLDAAGLLPDLGACHDDHHDDHAHTADNCSLIEEDAYQSAALTLKVTEPVALCECLLQLILLTEASPPVIEAPAVHPPPDLQPSWQFIARAAPPARAPSLNA